jgi:hypothetical protein
VLFNSWSFLVLLAMGMGLGLVIPIGLCHAQTQIPPTMSSGGGTSASTSYEQTSAVGMIGGVSNLSAPLPIRIRQGFPGLLFEIIGLVVSPTAATTNESGTFQLVSNWQTGDGGTMATEPGDLTWHVLGGPAAGVSSSGIVVIDTVYQDSSVVISATGNGFTAFSTLTVLDTIPDNHGTYAADQIDDAWQVGFFGEDNPLGAAGADPDGDGQNNFYEFTAGISPIDPASRFLLSLVPSAAHPEWRYLVFSPRFASRSYQILRSDRPDGPWHPLPGGLQSDQGFQRTVIDANPPQGRAFYRIGIVKP